MKSKKIRKISLNLWKGKLEMINQPHWLELTVIGFMMAFPVIILLVW